MKTVMFSEFRKRASGFLSEVERGETILVLRYGKPVAEITPASPDRNDVPSWRRPGLRLVVKGAALSTAIIEERRRREDVL